MTSPYINYDVVALSGTRGFYIGESVWLVFLHIIYTYMHMCAWRWSQMCVLEKREGVFTTPIILGTNGGQMRANRYLNACARVCVNLHICTFKFRWRLKSRWFTLVLSKIAIVTIFIWVSDSWQNACEFYVIMENVNTHFKGK